MMASQGIPVYTVSAISGNIKYNLTPLLLSIDFSDSEKQIAQRVTLQLTNILVDGTWLSSIFQPRDRIFIHANDGSKSGEVFRGYLWGRNYKSSIKEHTLKLTCYDNLIYMQESEDSLYFSAGKSTKDIATAICNNWGVKLNYSYSSIHHEKMPLRGKIYEILTADVLDLVRKRTGKKYVVISDQDTMHIKHVGQNTTIYKFLAGKNVTSTSSGWTMDGIITQVVILGKADDNDRDPVEAIVTGNTSGLGTLQKIESRDENTSLADAKLEAKNTIDESGKPKWEYEIDCPDIPWVRKGDKVFVDAGDINEKYLIVTAVNRAIDMKTRKMTMTLEDV